MPAALYRNPMADVQRFLKERHGEAVCVYNLCSEERYAYQPAEFEHVANFPFDDHQASGIWMSGTLHCGPPLCAQR